MEPTKELIDAIYREKVIRARQTPPVDILHPETLEPAMVKGRQAPVHACLIRAKDG